MANTQLGNTGHISEINVTPFVDVMLVLLVIFMVTAPMMMRGEDVELPATTSKPIAAKTERLVITLDKSQAIFINEHKTSLDSLQDKLAAIHKARPETGVFLRADAALPYGFVVQVMAAVKGAGIKRIGMVTQAPKGKRR